jgi:hypothetical protein
MSREVRRGRDWPSLDLVAQVHPPIGQDQSQPGVTGDTESWRVPFRLRPSRAFSQFGEPIRQRLFVVITEIAFIQLPTSFIDASEQFFPATQQRDPRIQGIRLCAEHTCLDLLLDELLVLGRYACCNENPLVVLAVDFTTEGRVPSDLGSIDE